MRYFAVFQISSELKMKKLLLILSLPMLLASCDDGDIIVTDFAFEEIPLNYCGAQNNYVFYQINSDTKESLSLKFGSNINLFAEAKIYDPIIIDGVTNFVNYRTYDGAIPNNYFCQSIPPTSPKVTVDYLGSSGQVIFTTTFNYEDNDGVPNEKELNLDTDSDSISNNLDQDDDGDNVPTRLELDTLNEDGDDDPLTNPKDTDNDGVPDYLDNDDDGDGIFTIFEDKNLDLDPTNDSSTNGIPDYLNKDVGVGYPIDEFIENVYIINKDIKVTLKNLVLTKTDEEITKESLSMGTIKNAQSATITDTPDFVTPTN